MPGKKKDDKKVSEEDQEEVNSSEGSDTEEQEVDEEDAGEGGDDGSEQVEDLDFTVDDQIEEPLDHETLEQLDETIDQESHIVAQSATIRTTEYITKYEKTRVLGWRAQQICSGAAPMLRPDDKDKNGDFIFKDGKYPREPFEIALKELEHGRCPVIIGRRIPNGEKILMRVSNLKLI
jgi:DNA-directed RNA polymerase subunit K/omega